MIQIEFNRQMLELMLEGKTVTIEGKDSEIEYQFSMSESPSMPDTQRMRMTFDCEICDKMFSDISKLPPVSVL